MEAYLTHVPSIGAWRDAKEAEWADPTSKSRKKRPTRRDFEQWMSQQMRKAIDAQMRKDESTAQEEVAAEDADAWTKDAVLLGQAGCEPGADLAAIPAGPVYRAARRANARVAKTSRDRASAFEAGATDTLSGERNTGSRQPMMREGRFDLATTVCDGTLYVTGGYCGSVGLRGTAESFSFRDEKWTLLKQDLRGCRSDHGVFAHNKTLYAYGGWGADDDAMLRDTEVLDLTELKSPLHTQSDQFKAHPAKLNVGRYAEGALPFLLLLLLLLLLSSFFFPKLPCCSLYYTRMGSSSSTLQQQPSPPSMCCAASCSMLTLDRVLFPFRINDDVAGLMVVPNGCEKGRVWDRPIKH